MIVLVLNRGNRMGLADADREAVGTIISLGPPAVENREVQRAVQYRLLPDVPLASCGRRGLFSQTSTPCTRERATFMS